MPPRIYPQTVIRKIKRPRGLARWPAYETARDEYGVWLYSPKGTLYRGQLDDWVGECEVGQGNAPAGFHVMHLIPAEGWWLCAWCRESRSHISVDICTPPRRINGEWHYTDLELDPLLFRDGRVFIEDEDEFAEACSAGFIAPPEATQARAAADTTADMLRRRTEPFGQLGWDRLQEAIALSLPPLKQLGPA